MLGSQGKSSRDDGQYHLSFGLEELIRSNKSSVSLQIEEELHSSEINWVFSHPAKLVGLTFSFSSPALFPSLIPRQDPSPSRDYTINQYSYELIHTSVILSFAQWRKKKKKKTTLMLDFSP